MHVFDIELQKLIFTSASPLRISIRQLSQFIESVATAITTALFVSSFIKSITYWLHCTSQLYNNVTSL
jgi:hypothetical protein